MTVLIPIIFNFLCLVVAGFAVYYYLKFREQQVVTWIKEQRRKDIRIRATQKGQIDSHDRRLRAVENIQRPGYVPPPQDPRQAMEMRYMVEQGIEVEVNGNAQKTKPV